MYVEIMELLERFSTQELGGGKKKHKTKSECPHDGQGSVEWNVKRFIRIYLAFSDFYGR